MKLINVKISHIFKGKELIVSKDISETGKIKLDENGIVELEDSKAKILLNNGNWKEVEEKKTNSKKPHTKTEDEPPVSTEQDDDPILTEQTTEGTQPEKPKKGGK
jgi:hypothetical protein